MNQRVKASASTRGSRVITTSPTSAHVAMAAANQPRLPSRSRNSIDASLPRTSDA